MSSNGLLKLTDVRGQAAAALTSGDDADPLVLADVVDSVTPPVLMLVWEDPWLEPGAQNRTMGPCLWTARLTVLAIAARIEPASGIETLEELVSYALARMRDDAYAWPAATLQAPREFTMNGVPSLGARIQYRVPVTI